MKIYFAGPLFTPYVRSYISAQAQVLREHGIDPFVPHESFLPEITPERVQMLVAQGLVTEDEAARPDFANRVSDLMRYGKVSRDELGLAELTPETVFERDYEGLASADAVVALLDGTQVDDGTACEIGIFYGLMRDDPGKKGIIGFMTDFRGLRRAEHGYGTNLFVWGVLEECGVMLADFDEVIAQLKAWDSP
jgi:nucleoside 2-deoxyribosyltransferase